MTNNRSSAILRLNNKKKGALPMIRVLHKAFDILECLSKEPQHRKQLNEIAGHLSMNAGTCANILKTMVQRKFVDQAGRRGGYMLGPMMYYLSRLSAYRGDLLLVAEPLVAALAKKVNETVLLAVLRGNERFVILQIDGNQRVQVSRDMFFGDNIYDTATGRLLLAHSNEKELNAFLAVHGLPGSRWPEAKSLKKLKIAFEEIRRRGYALHQTTGNVMGIAYPINENGNVIAALGLFLPAFRFKGAHKTAIMKGMSATAAAISERLRINENYEVKSGN